MVKDLLTFLLQSGSAWGGHRTEENVTKIHSEGTYAEHPLSTDLSHRKWSCSQFQMVVFLLISPFQICLIPMIPLLFLLGSVDEPSSKKEILQSKI